MTQEQKFLRYGDPLSWDLARAKCPFPMVIAWDKNHTLDSFMCHKRIKDNIEAALDCILQEYGIDRIIELNLNQFGGCHNDRKMRGGSKWSSHAWGIAIDIDPKHNGLRTKAPKAAFSRPEYDPFMDIMYEHNFINYGIEKDYDWMHFEIKD